MSYRNQPKAIVAPYPAGGLNLTHDTRRGIFAHVVAARNKHPVFPRSWWRRFAVLLEEVCELAWAVVWERDKERIRSEALDCVAVLVRIVEGD